MQALCTALGFVGYSCSPENVALHQRFVDHMATFGLSYATTEELQFRFDQFVKADKFIEESNADPELTYESGHNQFSTWTDEEFDQMLGKLPQDTTDLPSVILDETTLPESKDWRAENKVSPVQNQGSCGGCWAFSVTAALESSYAIRKNLTIANSYKLSEQQFIDCVKNYSECCGGCHGGLEGPGFDYAKTNAITTNGTYPYAAVDQTCNATATATGVVNVDMHAHLTPGNATQIKQAVNEFGPTCVSIHASLTLQRYKKGILNKKTCLQNPINHAVTAVGFGKENSKEYLIVRNSWGPTWGEQGYFRISTEAHKETGICGILSDSRYVKAKI